MKHTDNEANTVDPLYNCPYADMILEMHEKMSNHEKRISYMEGEWRTFKWFYKITTTIMLTMLTAILYAVLM